jgi:hypothetical protein
MCSIKLSVVLLAVLSAALSFANAPTLAEDLLDEAFGPVSFEALGGDGAVEAPVAAGLAKDSLGGGCGSNCGKVAGCCVACQPKWGVRAGVLALSRERPDSAVLFVNPLNVAENMDAGDFDFGYKAGFDLSVMRRLECRPDIEFRYMGSDAWTARAGAVTTAADPLAINALIPVFLPTGRDIQAVYGSELDSFELNLRTDPWCGCVTWLVGFRYLELDEVFRADLVDAVTPAATVVYDATTQNRLYGVQVGAEVKLLEVGERLSLEFVGKAGIYHNSGAQATRLDTGAIVVPAVGRADRASFLGEAHLAANYCLYKNLSLRASYGVMGISDLALATDQMGAVDFLTGSGINASGNAFYHGAFLGLQFGY